MRTPEQRAKAAENMRNWRAANPERNREIGRLFKAKWRAEHPGEARAYQSWWREQNPKAAEAIRLRSQAKKTAKRTANPEPFRRRDKEYRSPYDGLPETTLHERFQAEHTNAVSMDRIRPDFYVPGEGFVEIKMALPFQAYNWRQQSVHFPGLYFRHVSTTHKRASGAIRTVDAQLALEPRPLLVIVYHALTGDEIIRRPFS